MLPASATSSTKGAVSTSSTGNMTRPPNRSARAPARIRPTEPTITGVATTSDFWVAESPIASV